MMNKSFVHTGYGGIFVMSLLLSGCVFRSHPPLPTASSVDLQRYQGIWYEIARYPNRFEKNCVGATAEYTLQKDGTVRVMNRCFEGTLDGPRRGAEGKAWVVDRETNSKLKVQFFWPFRGKYWILELPDSYTHVVVGEPSRKYLWILSRSPTLEPGLYASILGRLSELGYDPDRVERPPQKAQPDLEREWRSALGN